MTAPVLATKLFAPTPRAHLVTRPRLLARLDEGLAGSNRLTLVSGPAGFGKTMLVSAWLTHLEARSPDVRVGWLSLDEDDNETAHLLVHVLAALRGAGIEVGSTVAAPGPGPPVPTVLTGIVNGAVRAAEDSPAAQWVLVLDDYHVIETPDVHEAVTFLVEHLPGPLHVVVATRSDPPLPLARLRGRGQLTEVRAADLRFSQPEAVEFLNDVMGLELGDEDARVLEQRTEGWVAGLQLAALSLRGIRGRDEVTAFIETFAGSHRFVIDYLADEVLARRPVAVRHFLLRTAVLDHLTGSLCDAVTDSDGGGRVLEDLERDNLFLVPLDDQRSWYRYHHLFGDVLRARLLAEHPDEVPGLHRRASAWYALHDRPVDAVRHALAGEDHARAARLMEEALPDLRRARRDNLLLSWMGSLPASAARRSPVLCIWSAWAGLMSGDLDAMEHWLEDAEAALDAGKENADLALQWADTEDLRTAPATISMYRASLAQARGDVAGTVRHARDTLDLAGDEDHLLRGQGSAFLGLAAWAEGDVEKALETFGVAVRSLHAAGNLVDELDATVVLADMWVALGRPGRARGLYERALQRITSIGEPYPRATADLHVGLAELDRERDDLPSARQHLDTAHGLAQRVSITENRHRWYVAMAGVHAADADHDEADRLLGVAEKLYRRGFYPEIRPIPSTRARLAIATGDLAVAAGWARQHGVGVDDVPDYLREHEHLTLVRLLLAESRSARGDRPATGPSPLVAASALLHRLHAAAAGVGRDGSVVEILVLQALTHHAAGDEPAAVAAVERAVRATPEPEAHVRLYLDEGEPGIDLLRRAAAHGVALPPRLARHVSQVSAPQVRTRAQSLADPLSRRELDVLRLLEGELTGPAIARELYVSLNTLRTHTRRIFTKLDVNTRAAAVRRAHELGLL